MGWNPTRRKGEDLIEGTIGDKLTIHVTSAAAGFNGHTWLAVLREGSVHGDVVGTLTMVDDNSDADEIDLLLALADTSGLAHGQRYILGVTATAGAHAPYTLIPALPLVGKHGAARTEE